MRESDAAAGCHRGPDFDRSSPCPADMTGGPIPARSRHIADVLFHGSAIGSETGRLIEFADADRRLGGELVPYRKQDL